MWEDAAGAGMLIDVINKRDCSVAEGLLWNLLYIQVLFNRSKLWGNGGYEKQRLKCCINNQGFVDSCTGFQRSHRQNSESFVWQTWVINFSDTVLVDEWEPELLLQHICLFFMGRQQRVKSILLTVCALLLLLNIFVRAHMLGVLQYYLETWEMLFQTDTDWCMCISLYNIS